MKQTLIEIRGYIGQAAERGKEPVPQELADIISRRMKAAPDSARYMRALGEFLGVAMQGAIILPENWTPPD